MLVNQALGFRSQFVLMKLGHDLGEMLEETIDLPLPEGWRWMLDDVDDDGDGPHTLELQRREYASFDCRWRQSADRV